MVGAGLPTSAPGETPIPVTVSFGSAAGGTVTGTVTPGGTVEVSCKDASAPGTCSLVGVEGAFTVSATPTGYPAVLRLTFVNADGGATTVVDIPLTPPAPSLDGPTSAIIGEPLTLTIDTGTAAGGGLTIHAPGWADVALTGCTPTATGCTLDTRLATVTLTVTQDRGPAPALAPGGPAVAAAQGSLRITLTNAAGQSTELVVDLVRGSTGSPTS